MAISGQNQTEGSKSITGNGTTNGDSFALPNGSDGLMVVVEVSNFTDGSYTVQAQHSPDGGATWEDLGSVTAAQAAAGFKISRISNDSFDSLRLQTIATGVTTGASVKASLFYTNKK